MKMKLFRYGYLIRYAFDLGRIFPLISKQRGVSNYIAGIASLIIDAPTHIWVYFNYLDQRVWIFINGLLLGLVNRINLGVSNCFQPEVVIRSVFG